MTRFLDWAFRNRVTGRITVGQWPNLTLSVFLASWIVGQLVGSSSMIGKVTGIIASTSLAVWAADELIRGVNPWRRCLGGGVLAYLAMSALSWVP